MMKVEITHDHKCECIARAPSMGEGRDWWLGKLTHTVEEYPEETHCLHLKSPVKNVVYLCNMADFQQLQIICRVATGDIDDSWMDEMIKRAKMKSKQIEEE